MAEWWSNPDLTAQVLEEAEKGNAAMQCELARMRMAAGQMEEAVRWYKKAVAGGSSDAMFNLGILYAQGFEMQQPSAEQAFFWYEQAALAGDTEGMYMAADCLLNGSGTGRNQEEAVKWLKQALSAGYLPAQELLYTIPEMRREREVMLGDIEELAQKAEQFLANEDYEMAVSILQEAVSKSTQKLGESDACSVGLMNNLAVAFSGLKQFEKSIPLKEHVLELRGKSLPVTHPDYLTTVTNLTSDYAQVKRYQSAIGLSKQAYTAARETLPLRHEVLLLTLNRLAADYMNLCRHDLAAEQLEIVLGGLDAAEGEFSTRARVQKERAQKLLARCREVMETYPDYFKLDSARKDYAYICAELCEMLGGLDISYQEQIKKEEYAHYKEQASLVSCYQPHLSTGHAVETNPYTNALQNLLSLKYFTPAVAECREELDGIECRAIVTWVQNELCLIATVYPKTSPVEQMECPQPADFIKSLNACEDPQARVLELNAADLQMKRMKNGMIQISFAYGTGDIFRMIRMHYQEETNQLEGESAFMKIG